MSSLLSGISITCFASSYTIAWLLEGSRLFFRSGVRGAVMVGFAAAGFLAQTLYLGYRAASDVGSPLASSYDWCLLAAWLLVAGYLYATYYHPRAAIGLFVLPLVLLLIAAAGGLADREPIARAGASQLWGMIHGVFLLLGTVAVMVGFAAGVMYLVQASRLKRKLPPPAGLRFPSLEWLERVNGRVLVISTIFVAIGFLAGVVLNLSVRGQDELSWGDPVIWSSASMLGWLIAATLFNALYKPARHGRKVAYLTIASFGFLAIALAMLLLVDTGHGGRAADGVRGAARAQGGRP
jgi:ABC-type transport system involved in cytochrome c biogenesis permease subunit